MKLRHVSATAAYDFQQSLDHNLAEVAESKETVISIEHSVAQSTFATEFGSDTEITYSAIIFSMELRDHSDSLPTTFSREVD